MNKTIRKNKYIAPKIIEFDMKSTPMNPVSTPDEILVKKAIPHFPECGALKSFVRITQGHINDTFRVECEKGPFLLQRVSPVAFKEPLKVMKNIEGVTRFLHDSIVKEGGDPKTGCLNLSFP